jgi:SAM-dependent methyltransferase
MQEDRNERWLARVYGAADKVDLQRSYDQWAADYDRTMEGFGYQNPAIAAGLIGRHVPLDGGEILDAGCGTGFLGEILAPLGYRALVGIDFSEGMLERAAARGLYRELRRMDMSKPLDLADGRFAATVCFGVLTKGHVPPGGLDEMLRVTRAGGRLIFSISDPVLEAGFGDKIKALSAENRWEEVEITPPYRPLPGSVTEGDLISRIFVYRAVG